MRRFIVAALLALGLSSCSSEPEKPPPTNLGRVLACTMKVQGEWGFWLIYLESAEQKRIATVTNAGPDWSPDGFRVAWTDGVRLRTMRLDGTLNEPLPGGVGYSPAWSPDGSSIAWSTLNSVQSRDLTQPNQPLKIWTVVDAGCEHPTWSPDGTRLAMTDAKGDLIITDGSSEKRYPLNGARHPDWSPDGKRILLDGPDGTIRAFLVDSAEVVAVGNARGKEPNWLRDGKGFLTVWLGSGDDAPSVYEWDADGLVGKKLTGRDEIRDAAGNW